MPSRNAHMVDTLTMHIVRDAAGRLHIEYEGVSAIVDEHGGQSSLSMTSTATDIAIQRVCDLVADTSRWPTSPLPRIDLDLVDAIQRS